MTTKRICDVCQQEIEEYPRVELFLYHRWSDSDKLDVHAEKECLKKVPQLIADKIYQNKRY